MNWEKEDYRKLPPRPYMGPWPTWTVPKEVGLDYILKIAFFLVGLPYLFGVMFTSTGLLFNFLIIDWIVYNGYKRRLDEVYGEDDK